MKHVRKFGIWARSELGIEHDVWRAFRTGGIRTWGCNWAIKTNRLVNLLVVLADSAIRQTVPCIHHPVRKTKLS